MARKRDTPPLILSLSQDLLVGEFQEAERRASTSYSNRANFLSHALKRSTLSTSARYHRMISVTWS